MQIFSALAWGLKKTLWIDRNELKIKKEWTEIKIYLALVTNTLKTKIVVLRKLRQIEIEEV